MYETSLPSTEESPHVAGVWVRGIALAERPDLADKAGQLARDLVATAVRRTPPHQRIHVRVEASEQGLHLQVHDPVLPEPVGSIEWSEVSSITLSFGSRSSLDGHVAWADLRPKTAA